MGGIEEIFGPRFLNRKPTLDELRRITSEYESEGFLDAVEVFIVCTFIKKLSL